MKHQTHCIKPISTFLRHGGGQSVTEPQNAQLCGSGGNLAAKYKFINLSVACKRAFEKLVCRSGVRASETNFNILILGGVKANRQVQ